MPLVQIYECLCDETRLRIVQLLSRGPLCVCHLQAVLDIPQARVSQHLAYLRDRGMVGCRRRGTWMIYSLPEKPGAELARHLACLQDCSVTDKRFRADLRKLKALGSTRPALLRWQAREPDGTAALQQLLGHGHPAHASK